MSETAQTSAAGAAGQLNLLIVLLTVAALAVIAYLGFTLTTAKAEVEAAANDLTACRMLAKRIEHLRGRPAMAGTSEVDHAELAGRIERAATTAGVPQAALVQITPGEARRIGDTAYLEKPTAITLSGVRLRPLVIFLHALTVPAGSTHVNASAIDPEPALTLRDLRLSTPPGQEVSSSVELWAAEVTLVYRIYSPQTRSSRNRGSNE